jgi:microtubule-associated protein-like 6
MYDFDESGVLTLDEMVLCFRSTLSGLSKLSRIDPPTESEIEMLVVLGFDAIRKSTRNATSVGPNDDAEFKGIDKEDFVFFCINTPELLSWIEYFDDLEEYEEELTSVKTIKQPVITHLDRDDIDEALMNPTTGGLQKLKLEKTDIKGRKNWENAISFLAPVRKPDPVTALPPKNIKLEWIYGINTHCSRQSVYYTAKGSVIYPAGAVCVIQKVLQHEQEYFIQHSDNITCLKLYTTEEGDTIVASGECGVRPAIHVWHCDTRILLSTLQGFHRNGVSQLDFSPDREKLVTLGMDPYHSLAVYKWRTRERVWSSRTTADAVHDVRFLSNNVLASCGYMHILFWRENKATGVFKRYSGQFGTAVKPETLYTVGVVGKSVFSGSETGMIYLWEGRNLIKSVKAHTGAIYASYLVEYDDPQKENGLITACSEGKVMIWNSKMELGATFNAASMGPIKASITSICNDVLTSKILVCFKTCEVFEMDSTDGRNIHNGGSVIAGHYHQTLCGLATHPTQSKFFCTVGNDKTVRIFNAVEKRQMKVSLLDTMGHCCTYSKDGTIIIIGLGSGIEGKEERKEGAFVALSEEDLTLLHEARDSKCLISDCKFAPNGEKFALASNDGSIYVYTARKYVNKSKCRGHTGTLKHVDFSSNSQYLMSNCSAGDLLFWDTDSGELQAPKSVKNVQWDTNTCVYSYATQGIWSTCQDGTQYRSACKSNAQDILIAVDNYGRIRVTNFPCLTSNPCFYQCYGHGKDIRNCQVSCDDTRLFTTGGTDGCVFQWKIEAVMQHQQPVVATDAAVKKDPTALEVLGVEMQFEGKALIKSDKTENIFNNRPEALCDLEEGLIDSSQMLPWQKVIVAPSRLQAEDKSEPADSLELEFVYGFTSDISRESIKYTPRGELLFISSSLAVQMNQKTRAQRFYNMHSYTITAVAVNPIDGVAATGDQGEAPTIRIWSLENMETISVFDGFHRRGIAHLKFSNNGKSLVSVGLDAFHSIAVYDWKNKQVISQATSFENKSFFIDFSPNGKEIIHCGNEIIRFWEMQHRNMHFTDAMYSSRAKLQGFLCAGWIGGSAVVGTVDGNLYRFISNHLDSIVLAHASAVNCIAQSSDGLCTGGADGYIKMWTRFLECRLVVELKSFNTISMNVRSIAWNTDAGRVTFGTASSEIFEFNAGDGENLHKGSILEGHGGDELWGLAVNPVKEEFCTVGDDAFLKVWDLINHTVVISVSLEMPARCCAFSPDGKKLAIGFGCPRKLAPRQFDGKWIVMDTDDYQISHEARDSNKWLTDIKYSPNNELIAIGSFDFKIYIYGIKDGYALNAVINQHQSFITSLDFSLDSAWLQSNCGGLELHYFEADTGLFIPAASRLRDTTWATQTCTLGWPVQGIWPPQKDGTEITACDCNLFRAEDGAIVAAGDNYGKLRIFRYPCTSAFAISKLYWTSANPITRIRFASGDSIIINLTGINKSIIQWRHRRDREENVAYDVLDRRGKLEEEDEDVTNVLGIVDEVALLSAQPNDLSHLISSRPWVASIVPPSNAKEFQIEKPLNFGVRLRHIIGLQIFATRGSVRYNNIGDIIFPASKFVCVYEKKTNVQIYYDGHANEISCITVSTDGLIAASAEKSNRPSIHIWDTCTCQKICKLSQLHRKGVTAMQFSADRKLLVSIGQDDDCSIALWSSASGNWADGKIVGWSKGDVNPPLFCSFYEQAQGLNSTGYLFASGGRYHQKFWKIDGKCINASYAVYDRRTRIGTLLCGTLVGNRYVSGSTKGQLFVWNGRKLDRMIRAHELGVTCIWAGPTGAITAAKDGLIKMWSLQFEHRRTYVLNEADVPPIISCVRSIDAFMSTNNDFINQILVATAGGEIYEIAAQSGNTTLIHEAHYEGELWGLATHPVDPDIFATVGDDRSIRIWSILARRLLRKAVIDCTARSISWSPDGKQLIIGMGGAADGKRQRKDGAFLILESATLKPLYEGR